MRGGNWDKADKSEDGNFTSLLELMKKYSPELKSHLQNSPRNARYLSPKIQNGFIMINADIIRKLIVDECNTSLFWSIMVDETTDTCDMSEREWADRLVLKFAKNFLAS